MNRRLRTLVVVLSAVALLLGIGIPTAWARSHSGRADERHWASPGRRHHFSTRAHRRHPLPSTTLPTTTLPTTSLSTTSLPTTTAPTSTAATTTTVASTT